MTSCRTHIAGSKAMTWCHRVGGWLGLALILCLAPAASAENKYQEAIQTVIGQQLDAFRHDDGARAFALASPGIQAMFGTPEVFLRAVAEAYPQVYKPRSAQFLDLAYERGRLVQKVLLQGRDGKFVFALYDMVEIDGGWRVNGCVLRVAPRDTV